MTMFFIGLIIGYFLPLPNYIFMKRYINQLDDEILKFSQMLNDKEVNR